MEAGGNLLVELILDFLHSKNLTQTAETMKKEYGELIETMDFE
jgi:hypothetical protein